jgi:DNA-binding LytR/AlgR family response regulator
MTIGQTVSARFKTIPNLLKSKSTADEETYPIRTGEIIYIHPKGRFISVRTETAGGPVVENFRLCEVVM